MKELFDQYCRGFTAPAMLVSASGLEASRVGPVPNGHFALAGWPDRLVRLGREATRCDIIRVRFSLTLSPHVSANHDGETVRLRQSEAYSSEPIWQSRYYGFNIWSRAKVEEEIDYMHLNPVWAGLVEGANDWPWSSARWYLERRSVGLPIRWPPGLEYDDDFTTNL